MATYYQIINSISGADLGTFQADSGRDALDMMARDAGYDDYEQVQEVAPAQPGEMAIREIQVVLAEIAQPEEEMLGLKASDLRDEYLETEEETEAYRVEIAGKAEQGDLLWFPAIKRGAFAWGADAIWTDADSAEDVVVRCLTDRVLA